MTADTIIEKLVEHLYSDAIEQGISEKIFIPYWIAKTEKANLFLGTNSINRIISDLQTGMPVEDVKSYWKTLHRLHCPEDYSEPNDINQEAKPSETETAKPSETETGISSTSKSEDESKTEEPSETEPGSSPTPKIEDESEIEDEPSETETGISSTSKSEDESEIEDEPSETETGISSTSKSEDDSDEELDLEEELQYLAIAPFSVILDGFREITNLFTYVAVAKCLGDGIENARVSAWNKGTKPNKQKDRLLLRQFVIEYRRNPTKFQALLEPAGDR